MVTCFRINRLDNVATMLHDAVAGGTDVRVLGESNQTLKAREPIKLGHKIALVDIPEASQIIKLQLTSISSSDAMSAWVTGI